LPKVRIKDGVVMLLNCGTGQEGRYTILKIIRIERGMVAEG